MIRLAVLVQLRLVTDTDTAFTTHAPSTRPVGGLASMSQPSSVLLVGGVA